MEKLSQQIIARSTSKGELQIRSFCTPEEIRRYHFDSQFGSHAHYKSLYTRRESLEENARLPETNVTLALTDDGNIIGFGVLAYPEEGERWAKLAPRLMMEVKAIEVVRKWRFAQVARAIVEMMLMHPLIEDKIVYLVGYSWTWDLDGNSLSAQQYRQVLIRLFEPFGFQEFETNESNICLKPENMLLGRVGKNISPEQQNSFKWLRFDVYPETGA
jgi:acetoin utilization protein AcuA